MLNGTIIEINLHRQKAEAPEMETYCGRRQCRDAWDATNLFGVDHRHCLVAWLLLITADTQ